jgi:hypothetical protein
VGHSLGGALIRRATLDALFEQRHWAKNAHLLLFAPAHRGALLAKLKSELKGAGKLFAVLSAMVDLGVPVFHDLLPGSQFISAMKEDALKMWENNAGSPVIADRVIHGQLDKVVVMERFCHDPPSKTLQGHSHTSVCKVSAQFVYPLEEVLRLI